MHAGCDTERHVGTRKTDTNTSREQQLDQAGGASPLLIFEKSYCSFVLEYMTAMTNGISSTPGAPIIEISKSPNKSINNINQHTPKKNIGVYREKESNQQTARGTYIEKSLSCLRILF